MPFYRIYINCGPIAVEDAKLQLANADRYIEAVLFTLEKPMYYEQRESVYYQPITNACM